MASAVIITPSAQTRDSLLVLLRAMPQIETIHQVEKTQVALSLGPQLQPEPVVVDDALSASECRRT
jgi:hypothetical protein